MLQKNNWGPFYDKSISLDDNPSKLQQTSKILNVENATEVVTHGDTYRVGGLAYQTDRGVSGSQHTAYLDNGHLRDPERNNNHKSKQISRSRATYT